MTTLNIFGIEENSFVDGPGVRFAIFLQGCPHHCPGCHNPKSQLVGDEYGQIMSVSEIMDKIKVNAPYISGVTLSGGEPFMQSDACIELMKAICAEYPGFNNWIWSGWTYEQLISHPERKALLNYFDVLVDGPFVLEDRTLELPWRGSPNQRLIDLRKTTDVKNIILFPEL